MFLTTHSPNSSHLNFHLVIFPLDYKQAGYIVDDDLFHIMVRVLSPRCDFQSTRLTLHAFTLGETPSNWLSLNCMFLFSFEKLIIISLLLFNSPGYFRCSSPFYTTAQNADYWYSRVILDLLLVSFLTFPFLLII